jgi:hypothetical protein
VVHRCFPRVLARREAAALQEPLANISVRLKRKLAWDPAKHNSSATTRRTPGSAASSGSRMWLPVTGQGRGVGLGRFISWSASLQFSKVRGSDLSTRLWCGREAEPYRASTDTGQGRGVNFGRFISWSALFRFSKIGASDHFTRLGYGRLSRNEATAPQHGVAGGWNSDCMYTISRGESQAEFLDLLPAGTG